MFEWSGALRLKKFCFSQKLLDLLSQATPSLQVRAYHRGEKVVDEDWGTTYPYYDWASVTKVVFTTTAVMMAIEQKKLRLEEPIKKHLPWFPDENLPVQNLLSHYSGLEWWLPVYEEIREEKKKGWDVLKKVLSEQKIKSEKKSVYSDLDFWVLGFLLEEVYEKPLLEVWYDVAHSFELEKTHLHQDNQPVYERELYAPTEDCPWRGPLQGEVHDDNAWSFGGVAAHAGLFGPMDDLAKWALKLREIEMGTDGVLSSKTVQLFFQQKGPGRWASGFMMPDLESSAVGNKMSRKAVGHWGFTGTGVWFDREKDVIVITLSNRVHPSRENKVFPKEVRPQLHDEIYTWLGF